MRKTIVIFIVCVMIMCSCLAGAAERNYVNEQTDYWAHIEDNAELFQTQDGILDKMKHVTAYTNILVYTTSTNITTSSGLCKSLAEERFGTGNGVVFLIDMDNRYIYVYGHNDTYDVITERVGNTITDNCYDYASDERYDQCAKEAVSQIYMTLSGEHIPEPMRYIGNLFLAIMIGVSLTSVFACYSSRIQAIGTTSKDVELKLTGKQRDIIDVKRVYRSSSSSSGSGGGGRSGGGGGGSRGGGGGHRF